MLLKTKLILVFTFALFIFGITQAYFKFQDLQATIQSEVQSRDAANSVIWLKIVSQISNNMEFYAQGSESGGSPIWTLRGKRSPVDSIKSGNVKRLEITLTPFYEDLTSRGVIDSMAVYTNEGELLHGFASDDYIDLFNNNAKLTCADKNSAKFLKSDKETFFLYAFDVFSNGVPVGCVVYAKSFSWLSSRYYQDTGSEVTVEIAQTDGIKIPFSFKDLFTSLLSKNPKYVAITKLQSNFAHQQGQLFSVSNMTKFVRSSLTEKYRDLVMMAFYLVILFCILIFLTTREFSKLNIAIRRLQDLSKGRLTSDTKIYENNEVGRIMKAVQELNRTIDSYSANRKNIQVQRETYIGNLYQSIEDMSVHLPKDLRSLVTSQIKKNSTEPSELVESDNIFAEKEDTSIRLVNEVLGGISREINKQIERQTELTNSYQRFVPAEIVTALDKTNITQVKLGDQKERAAYILFTDIRNFTKLSEKLTSHEVFELLNKLLNSAIPTVSGAGGYIDKFIGDAILAVFDTEGSDPVKCGIELLKSLEVLNKDLLKSYGVEISIGIGVHYGPVVLGTIGNNYRMEGTVIGDTVNTASRLETLTKQLRTPFLVSGEVINKMRDEKGWHYRDPRRLSSEPLKGKTERVDIFEITDWREKKEADIVASSARLVSDYIDAASQGQLSDQLIKELRAHIDMNSWDTAAQAVFDAQPTRQA